MTNDNLDTIEIKARNRRQRQTIELVEEIRKFQKVYTKLLDENTRSILARETIREAFEGTLVQDGNV